MGGRSEFGALGQTDLAIPVGIERHDVAHHEVDLLADGVGCGKLRLAWLVDSGKADLAAQVIGHAAADFVLGDETVAVQIVPHGHLDRLRPGLERPP